MCLIFIMLTSLRLSAFSLRKPEKRPRQDFLAGTPARERPFSLDSRYAVIKGPQPFTARLSGILLYAVMRRHQRKSPALLFIARALCVKLHISLMAAWAAITQTQAAPSWPRGQSAVLTTMLSICTAGRAALPCAFKARS